MPSSKASHENLRCQRNLLHPMTLPLPSYHQSKLAMMLGLLVAPCRCLAFSGGGTTSLNKRMVDVYAREATRLLSTSKPSADDVIETFGPDEPSILANDEDREDAYSLKLSVPTPEDMEDVGAVLSIGTGGGDTILLGGDLGAGKTCFSRGFVRARTGNIDARVTSPTYLLCNTYPAQDGVLIHHMDLYRLSGKEEDLKPLDMDHALNECISLIEWPSRLGKMTPTERLDITFRITHDEEESGDGKDGNNSDEEDIERTLTLRAHGRQWEDRLKFLEEEGYVDDLIIE